MRFIPLTTEEKRKALGVIGAKSVDELFASVPDKFLLKEPLRLEAPLDEYSLLDHLTSIASQNSSVDLKSNYTGAGAYPHYTPSAVDQLLLRSELFTAYTPYQPEISQGTLLAIYEFQTYTSALLGMDMANASMYDGASALAEAVIMAQRIKGRKGVTVSDLTHPHWREVLGTYTSHLDIDIRTIRNWPDGKITSKSLEEGVTKDTAAVVASYPNFFGAVEDLQAVRDICDETGALMIVAVPEPVALGVLKPPGEFGADIVVGEGRSFGGALNYGGPGLGMFATRDKWARKMPGRLVGKTKDVNGEHGYVLTLATREQHIRRERATSNICSNQALCATAAAIHLSLLGKQGLRELAISNFSSASYLASSITSLDGFELAYDTPFFNETAITSPVAPVVMNRRLAQDGIQGGLDLSTYYPDMRETALFCGTEVHTKESIDNMVSILSEFER